MSKSTHNIFCLETEWYFSKVRLQDPFSSEPLLMMMENTYDWKYVYRRVATREELTYSLRRLKLASFSSYDVVYLTFHGEQNCIILEGEGKSPQRYLVSFDELADILDGALAGKFVHFSSCETLSSELDARRFKRLTKAKLISGYTKTVNNMRSSIADLSYFDILQNYSSGYIKKAMLNKNKDLCNELGFVIY